MKTDKSNTNSETMDEGDYTGVDNSKMPTTHAEGDQETPDDANEDKSHIKEFVDGLDEDECTYAMKCMKERMGSGQMDKDSNPEKELDGMASGPAEYFKE